MLITKQKSFILSFLFNISILLSFFVSFSFNKHKDTIIKTQIVFENQSPQIKSNQTLKPAFNSTQLLQRDNNKSISLSGNLKLNSSKKKIELNNKIKQKKETIEVQKHQKITQKTIQNNEDVLDISDKNQVIRNETNIVTEESSEFLDVKEPQNQSQSQQSTEKQRYQNRIRISVLANWTLPEHLKKYQFESFVRLEIDSKGAISRFSFEQSSNNTLIDQAIQNAIKKAAPFPAFPPSFTNIEVFIARLKFSDDLAL